MSDTRDKIIDSMYRLIAEKGYDKTSIGLIAEDIGIKKASIYYHFKSKEEIFLTMIDVVYDYEIEEEMAALNKTTDPEVYRSYLVAYGNFIVDWYQRKINFRKVCREINAQSRRIQSVGAKFAALDAMSYEIMKDVLQHGINIGAFPPEFDVSLHAQLMEVMLKGLDDVELYSGKIDCKAVWKLFAEKMYQ